MSHFSDDQIERYSRHILLPEVGGVGQRKLLDSRVLVIGAGGLGSPVCLYLAAAGVGTIGIVDSDVVDLSNLQRQVLHAGSDLGRPKCLSARETMQDINSDVRVVPHQLRLDSGNVLDVIADYDVIVDGADNFPTRYLANDACVLSGKPLSHAGILRFEGHVTTILPGKGPCYRCLYPEPPPPGLVPSCQEAGILGAVAGIIGAIQAAEVLKLILGLGDVLAGRLLVFDALDMSFRTFEMSRQLDCPVCGKHPSITTPIDYEEFCGLSAGAAAQTEVHP
jgi:molybdopterin/thiamine biosynthesis adenylyltransferase